MKLINFLATDGIELNGILYNSKTPTKKIILAVHGMSSNCMKERDEIIAQYANKNDIDYFCFNNRGSELVKYIKRNTDRKKLLGGTSYEDVLEGYEDITGAILMLKNLGYEEIYLQGHSLGCTKIVYTYNKLKKEKNDILDNIKGIILLSLVDIPSTLNVFLGDKLNSYIKYAEKLEQDGKQNELMPKESFIHPVSVKTFLRYARDNKEIDFASYGKDKELKTLNNIGIPLFMRWGNVNEMILQNAQDLVNMLNKIIKNPRKDINFIDGADHGYKDRREELAKQVINFIIGNANK